MLIKIYKVTNGKRDVFFEDEDDARFFKDQTELNTGTVLMIETVEVIASSKRYGMAELVGEGKEWLKK